MTEKISVRLVLVAGRLTSTDKDRQLTTTREFESLPQVGHAVQLADNLEHYRQFRRVELVAHRIDGSIDIRFKDAFASVEIEKLKEAGWVET